MGVLEKESTMVCKGKPQKRSHYKAPGETCRSRRKECCASAQATYRSDLAKEEETRNRPSASAGKALRGTADQQGAPARSPAGTGACSCAKQRIRAARPSEVFSKRS